MTPPSLAGLPLASVTVPSTVDVRDVNVNTTLSFCLNSYGVSVMSRPLTVTDLSDCPAAPTLRINSPIRRFIVNVRSGCTIADGVICSPAMV